MPAFRGVAMAIFDIVRMTKAPATQQSLDAQLREIGLDSGQIVLLHSSLASLGWVCGGANAVIAAILGVFIRRGKRCKGGYAGGGSSYKRGTDEVLLLD